MTNYIQTWLHGEEATQRTRQISARIEVETIAKLEDLMETFGISKTEAIQGALDTGLDDLLEEANRIFTNKAVENAAKSQGKEGEFKKMMKGAKDA